MQILGLLGMYFDAVVVEFKTFLLLFKFALAILCALRFGCTSLNEKKIGNNNFRKSKINEPIECQLGNFDFPTIWTYSNICILCICENIQICQVGRRVIFWLNGFRGLTNMKVREGNLCIKERGLMRSDIKVGKGSKIAPKIGCYRVGQGMQVTSVSLKFERRIKCNCDLWQNYDFFGKL